MYFLPASKKKLLNSINPIATVTFAWGLILLRSTTDPLFPTFIRSTDILLPFIVYVGQRRPLMEGLVLSLVVTHLYSLCSAAPIGVFISVNLVLFLVAHILSHAVYANRKGSILVLMFSLFILSHFILWAVASIFGHGWGVFNAGWWMIGKAAINAFLGLLIYAGLAFTDRITFKATRLNIELGVDEL